jgi:hypothetical protein
MSTLCWPSHSFYLFLQLCAFMWTFFSIIDCNNLTQSWFQIYIRLQQGNRVSPNQMDRRVNNIFSQLCNRFVNNVIYFRLTQTNGNCGANSLTLTTAEIDRFA